jgi:uncharacterized protein (TIGR04222 family)
VNPFDLPGPDFLRLYLVVFVAVMAMAGLLRWFLRLPGGDPQLDTNELSPFEIAYLAGGKNLALNAAIARLVHDDALALDTSHVNLKTTEAGAGGVAVASDVEGAIMAAVATGALNQKSIDKVREEAAESLEPVRERLEDLGLLVGDRQPIARIVPLAFVLLVVLFGVIKIFVGLARNRPVSFLVILCGISVIAALVCFARPVFRSRRGDRALAQLKKANSALNYQAQSRLDDLAGDDVVMALGLFGMGLLAGSRIADVRTALRPLPPRSTIGGSSGWFGCGSGCGGGGGCGGGCGGGGCGGCGG